MTAAPLPLPPVLLRCETRRFGPLNIPASSIYWFPHGLPGFAELHEFALLPVRDGVGWLQALELASLAFLLVVPGLVVAGAWAELPGAWAIVTLGETPASCTANLRAPLILDPAQRTGEQRITQEESWSVAHPLNLMEL